MVTATPAGSFSCLGILGLARLSARFARCTLLGVPQDALTFSPAVLSAASAAACSVAAPFWFWLATILRPASYIRLATALVSVSYCLAFVSLYTTQLLSIAVGLTALTNLVACPLLGLGMLGEEDVHVFQVCTALLYVDVGPRVVMYHCRALLSWYKHREGQLCCCYSIPNSPRLFTGAPCAVCRLLLR